MFDNLNHDSLMPNHQKYLQSSAISENEKTMKVVWWAKFKNLPLGGVTD